MFRRDRGDDRRVRHDRGSCKLFYKTVYQPMQCFQLKPIGIQFLTLFGMSPQNFGATQLQVLSGLLDVGFI